MDPQDEIAFMGGYVNVYSDKEKVTEYKESYFCEPWHPLYKYHESFTIWDKIYRKDFLLRHNIQLAETRAAVDVPFILKAYFYASKVKFLNNPKLYYYRRSSPNSVTNTHRRSSYCDFEFEVYSDIRRWIHDEHIPAWYEMLVDVKMVNSFLYTISIIGDQYKDSFKAKASELFKKLDPEITCKYLDLIGRSEHKMRFLSLVGRP
jgi:hypothetical protein